jgi:hypothetical protein
VSRGGTASLVGVVVVVVCTGMGAAGAGTSGGGVVNTWVGESEVVGERHTDGLPDVAGSLDDLGSLLLVDSPVSGPGVVSTEFVVE